jgi:hypothetical protein
LNLAGLLQLGYEIVTLRQNARREWEQLHRYGRRRG